jgi:DNA-binding GntR family transcriptional regulator
MREVLEPLLLGHSVSKLTVEDIARLGRLASEAASTRDLDQFLELDREFHLGMYACAETSQLGELVVKLWNTTQPYRRAYTRSLSEEAWRTVHDEHRLLITALRELFGPFGG